MVEHARLFMCMYIYIYIHTHIHTYTHTYTDTDTDTTYQLLVSSNPAADLQGPGGGAAARQSGS